MYYLHYFFSKINTYIKLTILLLATLQGANGQQFRNYLELGNYPFEISADSAFKTSLIAYNKALQRQDTSQIINKLIALSTISRALPDYSAAFDYAGQALFLAEQYKQDYLLARANEEIGVLHYLFVQNSMAGKDFTSAYQYYQKAMRKKLMDKEEMYYAYYNMVLYYNRINNFEKAYAFIDSCESVIDIHDTQKLYDVYLNEKRSILNSRQGKQSIALSYLHNCEKKILAVKRTSPYYLKHQSFLIVIYASMANIHKKRNELKRSKRYFEQSLRVKDHFREHTFYLSFVHEEYAELLYKLGESQAAYTNIKTAKHINDVYLNPRKASAQGFVKIKDKYEEELQERNLKINTQKLELSESKARELRFKVFFYVAMLLLASAGFAVRARFQHLKHQKENDLNEKQQQLSHELLEHKNKELTANMLQLIEKEEIIKTLTEKLKASQPDGSTKILLSSIDKQSSQMWEAFNSRFMQQNKDFYKRLQQKVPNLSAADLKVCALIKLNFTGKEMANLLGISLGSVHVARHRLRKKMHIERDQNLTQFINSI